MPVLLNKSMPTRQNNLICDMFLDHWSSGSGHSGILMSPEQTQPPDPDPACREKLLKSCDHKTQNIEFLITGSTQQAYVYHHKTQKLYQ